MTSNQNDIPMISPIAKRYMVAYHKLQNDMPRWKKDALLNDLSSSNNSNIVQQFTKDVTTLAEDDSKEIFLTE